MMNSEEVKKNLSVLRIQAEVSAVTLKDVNDAFRKLAAVLHPDKAGGESTAVFQELLNSCHILRKYFKEKPGAEIAESDHDKFFDDNFEKFNYPFENKGSFTVIIEEYLADTWQECIQNILGEPKIVKNGWGTDRM